FFQPNAAWTSPLPTKPLPSGLTITLALAAVAVATTPMAPRAASVAILVVRCTWFSLLSRRGDVRCPAVVHDRCRKETLWVRYRDAVRRLCIHNGRSTIRCRHAPAVWRPCRDRHRADPGAVSIHPHGRQDRRRSGRAGVAGPHPDRA